ncbi:MAG TPA: hypothetical protein DDX98_10495 [Bacteroidales bacterium]|jgi:hypothetical protein|nr:hypothetical protein [Bacteroidales bacterium]
MKNLIYLLVVIFIGSACKNNTELSYEEPDAKVIFLHHSTGMNVYKGKREFLSGFSSRFEKYSVPMFLQQYNEENGTKYAIKEQNFPTGNPYPWNNYPYDYYNIWVKNAGHEPYMEEPTLEMLTKEYDVIIFKHCFPVSNILEDDSVPDINSDKKTLANYKLQYTALKEKLHEFSETKFIVWTGAALVESKTTAENAKRAQDFAKWVTNIWGAEEDNIYIWDFRKLQTDGGLYLPVEKAKNEWDSHLNPDFGEVAAKDFTNKIISVIEN